MTDERYGEVHGAPSRDLQDNATEPFVPGSSPMGGLPDVFSDAPGVSLPHEVYGGWEYKEGGGYQAWDTNGNQWKLWVDSQGHVQSGYTDPNGVWHDADRFEFAPSSSVKDLVLEDTVPDLGEEPAHAPPVPDPGPMQETLDYAARAGVEGVVGGPTEEAEGTAAHDAPDPNAAAQPRTDTSDAHQPGGFHPSYESQWPYGEVSLTDAAKSWPYGEVSPEQNPDLIDQPDPFDAGAYYPPNPGETGDPNTPAEEEPPEALPWPYGEVSPTEGVEQPPWPYGEVSPTGQASFLEQSGAGTGLGDFVDPRLTEDPSTAPPDVQEQEDFFEGV